MSQRYNAFFRAALLILLALISTNASSFTFDWAALDWVPGGPVTHHYDNVDGSGVNVIVTVSGITSSFRDSPLREGDKLRLKAIFAHRSDTVNVKFTFSEAITIAGFRVWNIDSGTSNSYQDAISVSANAGAKLPENVFTGTNVEQISLGNYQSLGQNLPTLGDLAGVQILDFSQRITEFTVVYKPGTSSPENPSEQSVWLSGFTFAKPVLPAYLSVTKTANPPGGSPVSEGNKIDYTITITNDSLVRQTGIRVNDPLPGGTSYDPQSTRAEGFHAVPSNGTFADNFETGNYSGYTGTHRFSTSWTEVDNQNHSGKPGYSNGSILVDSLTSAGSSGQSLQITAKDLGDHISRSLDLTSIPVTTATLTYRSCNDLGQQDVIVARVYNSNTQTWHTLQTFREGGSTSSSVSSADDDDADAADTDAAAAAADNDFDDAASDPKCVWEQQTFDISSSISPGTQIGFLVTGSKHRGTLYIDDVVITVTGSTVSAITKDNIPAGTHPDLANGVPPTLVVPTDGFTLEPHQTMTVHYSVTVGKTGNLRSIDNTASVTSDLQATATTGKVSNPLKGHDFGDAPASYGHAAHLISNPIKLYLGVQKPDAEPSSQDSPLADGDDNLNKDDEDGVIFTTDVNTHSVTATVTVNNTGAASWLCGWLDINGNGVFEDTVPERHCTHANSTGTVTLTWAGLPKDRAYTTFARFRVTTDVAAAGHSTGSAPDGEVEDYQVSYDFNVLDFGDTPVDGTSLPLGGTTAYGNPSHRIHQYLHIGAGDPDSESDTQHSAHADGDDNDGNDDENGVQFSFNATASQITAKITVTNATGAAAKLCGWLDGSKNGIPDGTFAGLEGQCVDVPNSTINGVFTFSWLPPVLDSYVRFRLSSDTSVGVSDATTANKGNGEVEDYFLFAKKDFGDAPLLYGIPSHGVPATPALYMGGQGGSVGLQIPPDVESTHQPSLSAEGDDDNDTSGTGAGNDEDGFVFTQPHPLEVGARNLFIFNDTGKPSKFCLWFDENSNGVFDSSEGRCTQVEADGNNPSTDDIQCSPLPLQPNIAQCELLNNPWVQPDYSTFARARVTSDLSMNTATPDGYFPDGEVTDIASFKLDTGDALGYPAAFHPIYFPGFKRPYIGAVAPDVDDIDLSDPLKYANAAADFDDTHGTADEGGVTFSSPAGTGHSIIATIAVNIPGSEPVKLCGWLDQNLPWSSPASFDAVEGQCMEVNDINCKDLSLIIPGAFVCEMRWSGLPTTRAYTTYARFRISSDTTLGTDKSTGVLWDGEAQDYRVLFDFTPTAVTIGKVELQALPAAAFLGELGIEQMDDAALLDMLVVWDPAAAANLAAADRDTILSALQLYLDPDGDGQVAVLAWDTLEERGTIGFYVDRREAGGDVDWVRINNDMLPGLITAPMGGEYQLADPDARSGKAYQYQLIEQEARGTTRRYGPYDLVLP